MRQTHEHARRARARKRERPPDGCTGIVHARRDVTRKKGRGGRRSERYTKVHHVKTWYPCMSVDHKQAPEGTPEANARTRKRRRESGHLVQARVQCMHARKEKEANGGRRMRRRYRDGT
eukprot:scaffold12565_cov121-Isochrysis_galbana.AAC.5